MKNFAFMWWYYCIENVMLVVGNVIRTNTTLSFGATDSKFLASSQLATSIHWPCLLLIFVIVCGLFGWKWTCVGFFNSLFISVLPLEIYLSRGEGLGSH